MKTQAWNPFLPSYEYIPDGEPHVFDGRLYLYGSHDRFNGKTFCMNNYVAWSAPIDDLGAWRFEGEIYDKKNDPLCGGMNSHMYAPDVQRGPDGRYYLFYAFDFSGIISVAVCDRPTGQYRFFGHVHHSDGTLLGKARRDPFMFDPGVFVDDDHRIYLYTGFVPKPITKFYLLGKGKLDGAYVTELAPDFLTVKVEPRLIWSGRGKATDGTSSGHAFFEASSLRKFGDTYYFVYSSELNHELCHAIGKTPLGPFRYGGTLVSNANIGYEGRTARQATSYYGNNHGSLVQVNDAYYVFYHRQTNRHEYSRQACAERIVMGPDGVFRQTEMTSCGLNGGPLKGIGTYPAHIACHLSSRCGTGSYSPLVFKSYRNHPYLTQTGVDRNDRPDQYVANMRDGSVVGYKDFECIGLKRVVLCVYASGKGEIQMFNDLSSKPLASAPVRSGSILTDIALDIETLSGIHPLYFKYVGKGHIDLHRLTLS